MDFLHSYLRCLRRYDESGGETRRFVALVIATTSFAGEKKRL